eukprot:5661592-Prymnesium_polylepis.1
MVATEAVDKGAELLFFYGTFCKEAMIDLYGFAVVDATSSRAAPPRPCVPACARRAVAAWCSHVSSRPRDAPRRRRVWLVRADSVGVGRRAPLSATGAGVTEASNERAPQLTPSPAAAGRVRVRRRTVRRLRCRCVARMQPKPGGKPCD